MLFEFLHAKPSSLSPLLEWRREWQDCSLGCMMTECLFCFSFVQLSFSRPKKMMTKRMLEASCSSDPSPFALLHYGQPSLFGLFFVLLSSEIPTILGEVCAPPRWGSPCKLKTHCMGQGNWALCKLWFWDLCDSHLNSTWSSTHNILGRDQGCTLCRSTLCLHSSIAYPLWSRYHHLAALQHFRLLWPCSLHRQLWQPSSLSPPLEWRSNTREP